MVSFVVHAHRFHAARAAWTARTAARAAHAFHAARAAWTARTAARAAWTARTAARAACCRLS